MFEKEIKFISDFSLNKIKKLGSTFTYEKLSATDLHPAIIRYISAELDYMIYADRKKLLQQSYFDYTGKQISQHFHQISDEIKKSKKISMEDAEKLIIQAVSFNANFVVRPKWSLIKLIYNDQHSISVDDLEVMLKYVYYYDYIKNVLGAYLSKRKVVQLSLTEFELILNKIDRELFKSNSEQLIDNALNSIGDFFNIGGVDKTTVSASAIEILLKEKNLIEYLMKLRKNVPEGGKKKLSIEDIRRILYTPGLPGEGVTESYTETHSVQDITESESSTDTKKILSFQDEDAESETTIGELADKHAKDVELSETGELLTSEEEQKLLSLYEADLTNFEEDITDAISHKDDFDSFSRTDSEREINYSDELEVNNSSPMNFNPKDDFEIPVESEDITKIRSAEKDIVDEMLRDFFGDENESDAKTQEELKNISSDQQHITDNRSEIFEEFSGETEIPEEISNQKNDASLEDELLEVFDELEKLGEETEIDPEQEKPALSEFDLIDKDLETIDRIVFTDEKQKITAEKKVEMVVSKSKPEIKNQPVAEKPQGQMNDIKPPAIERSKPIEQEKPIIKSSLPKPAQADDEDFGRPMRKKDLLSYLKRKDIKKIISYVFSGDREDFVTTAERIMDCKGYKEASEILRSVFSSYKVSHYSKDAITLTNAVSNYFRQT